jgi:hypothetical protein
LIMMRNILRHLNPTRVFALATALMLTAGLVHAQKGASAVPSKRMRARIAHVLDRIGFGPRPGDIEHVQKMGLAKYIEQQLYPDKISDKALEERLADFPTLKMSTTELAQNYFNPADEARRLQQQAQARAAAAADPNMAMTPPGAAGAGRRGQPPPAGPPPAQPGQPGQPGQPPPPPQLTAEQRALQQKAQSVPQELMQGKMLREAMSERQLQEVLVRLLVQPLQCLHRQGPGAAVPDAVRARIDSAVRARKLPRHARRHGAQSRDAVLSG